MIGYCPHASNGHRNLRYLKTLLRLEMLKKNTDFTWPRVRTEYAKIVQMTEVTEGVTSTPEIFGNKHSFVLTFFATNTIYDTSERCKP